VSKIGAAACALKLDVTQEDQWRAVAAQTRDIGEVNIVVNNAGYFPNRSIDKLDLPAGKRLRRIWILTERKILLPGNAKMRWDDSSGYRQTW
jgi:3-oxoacyl-[acyl-carrier protein] reductase